MILRLAALPITLVLLPWTAVTAADATSASATVANTAVPPRENPGLAWLAAHQRDDGGWSGADDPGGPAGWDANGDDVAATALALEAFAGAGFYRDATDQFQKTLDAAYEFLHAHQQDDGGFGGTFTTAVAAAVLVDDYLSSSDPDVAWPAQRGLNTLRARQSANGAWGIGWPTFQCDTATTAWCVLTMRSGTAPHPHPGNALANAGGWLYATYQAANPNWRQCDPAHDQAEFPAHTSATAAAAAPPPAPDAQAVAAAAVCAFFLQPGEAPLVDSTPDSTPTSDSATTPDPAFPPVSATAAAVMFETLANRLVSPQLCQAATTDAMTAYLGTQVAFRLDDARWQRWNTAVVDPIRAAQHNQPGDLCGSWDPIAHSTSPTNGRVAVTALRILTLEMAYRHGRKYR